MGLFDRRRSTSKHRVPDLSRYSQQQPLYGSSDRESIISAGAAASALRAQSLTSSSYNPHDRYSQPPVRTMSMSSHRANSLSILSGQQRPGYGYQRAGSMTSNSSRLSQQPEKIIIRTTKTKDQYGRTTSITTETIRKMGSFELVKKETKDISLQAPPSVHYNGSLMENELDSILEEEDEDIPRRDTKARTADYSDSLRPPSNVGERAKSPVRSILKNGEKKLSAKDKKVMVLGEDEELSDGGSVYSDALDMLPQHQKMRKRISLDNVKVSEDTGFAAKLNRIDRASPNVPKPSQAASKPMSDDELYQMAYQVAMKKVYGDKSDEMPQEPKKGGFKTYSLRDNKKTSKKQSPRVNSSRTSSLTSLTKPPVLHQVASQQESSEPSTPIQNPTHSPEMEPTPKYSTDVNSPTIGLGLQEQPQEFIEREESLTQPLSNEDIEDDNTSTIVHQEIPKQEKNQKKARRKTSLSSFFAHPSMRYQNDVQSINSVNDSIFKRHSMRDSQKKDSTTKNYNYQLNNNFTPEGELSEVQPITIVKKEKNKKFSFGGLFKKKAKA